MERDEVEGLPDPAIVSTRGGVDLCLGAAILIPDVELVAAFEVDQVANKRSRFVFILGGRGDISYL